MRKDGFKSPNMADALIMAVSLVGEAKIEQEIEYTPRINQTAKDESLFNIAGIK
jgi:hypothetical protein